ncbi:MAG: hypothetical protein LRY45_03420 [Bacteroides graminisolvens]|nr:hypothetical protein [Bacteroides graminisolvens]
MSYLFAARFHYRKIMGILMNSTILAISCIKELAVQHLLHQAIGRKTGIRIADHCDRSLPIGNMAY